jgi:hypothetical protein
VQILVGEAFDAEREVPPGRPWRCGGALQAP